MSKATPKITPRLRKQHFSDAELNMLADTLAAHADLIKSQNLKREVHQQKKDIWQEVARKVSAVGTTTCSVEDCRKRWDDLCLRVRNIMASNRREAMATCGGPLSPAKMTTWEETASTFIKPESIAGFGEMETGVASSPGGTEGEDDSQDTTMRASTARTQKRATTTTTSGAAKQATPSASVPDTAETQLTTSTASVPDTLETQQPTPTPVEGESLVAQATTEDDLDKNVDQEGVTEVACHPPQAPCPPPGPKFSPQPPTAVLIQASMIQT
ncbi:myb-related transcription factor, partner of profilin-like [Ambystoma mexicanum]|uniref:myb-related transcription factor, partner of profilin-like n=1 Tax=Ambystoma mexicanum TaxID=8296 RepID=UPI0037E80B70